MLVAFVALLLHASPPRSWAGSESDGGTSEFFMPGTQPGELTKDLRPPRLCGDCHGFYAEYAANDTWQGTMMANAARDPLFQAALTIANQDVPGSGDLCIRCHSPRAWLFGRSSPPNLDQFETDDFEGVQCDFCHRLTPNEPVLIGTGQYTVADDFVRRGPIKDAKAPHDWVYSPYHQSSDLCGLCHDVSNPIEGGFAIERTYTEWKNSDFSAEGKSCQSCHMPEVTGVAAGNPNAPERIVHQHELAGGNAWVPEVLKNEHPELGREAAFDKTIENAKRMLASAAKLEVQAPDRVMTDEPLRFSVRVENLTGHKLPTGYPEGRRCWLEVELTDEGGNVLFHSGSYDAQTATRSEDDQLRTYEVRMADDGVEGFHFVLQNQLLQDNRIPPRGFRPASDTMPVGRDYDVVAEDAQGQVLAHFDVAPYEVEFTEPLSGDLHVEVRLWYQTASREYIEFLRDENQSDTLGERVFQLWEKYGRSEPVLMASMSTKMAVFDPSGRDAGETPGAVLPFDSGLQSKSDGGIVPPESSEVAAEAGVHCPRGLDSKGARCVSEKPSGEAASASGCGCRATSRGSPSSAGGFAFLTLLLALRRRNQ
jgi:hypothetical protein